MAHNRPFHARVNFASQKHSLPGLVRFPAWPRMSCSKDDQLFFLMLFHAATWQYYGAWNQKSNYNQDLFSSFGCHLNLSDPSQAPHSDDLVWRRGYAVGWNLSTHSSDHPLHYILFLITTFSNFPRTSCTKISIQSRISRFYQFFLSIQYHMTWLAATNYWGFFQPWNIKDSKLIKTLRDACSQPKCHAIVFCRCEFQSHHRVFKDKTLGKQFGFLEDALRDEWRS